MTENTQTEYQIATNSLIDKCKKCESDITRYKIRLAHWFKNKRSLRLSIKISNEKLSPLPTWNKREYSKPCINSSRV